MRAVAMGDIGVVDGMMHIGDEAMFEAFVTRASLRGVTDIVAISSNPADTAQRYGVESIGRIGLAGDRAAMLQRAQAILAGELEHDDPAHAVIDAVSTADRVVITGAGNLASTWPIHIIERWVIARLAHRAAIPLAISGQTIGPHLTDDDSTMLAELLHLAEVVGVRESASFELALRLGVEPERLQQTVDDASALVLDAAPAIRRPVCLVSLSTHVGATDRDEFVHALARLLDDMAASGLEVVFNAHFGPLLGEPLRGDVVIHERVRERMIAPSRVEPTAGVGDAVSLAMSASLVVSSRYHPAVFASAAGVPTVGIAVDDYTTVKLVGALGAFGQRTVITGAALVSGLGGAAIAEALAVTDPSTHERVADRTRVASSAWWDRVLPTQ